MIASKGHLCLFLPKFHPELNRTPLFLRNSFHLSVVYPNLNLPPSIAIERVWSAIKAFARKACQYTWDALKQLVPDAIASVTLVQVCT